MIRQLLFATTTAAAFLSANAQSELLAQTDLGPVQGHYNGAGAREWEGIPYAEPPVGSLRWEYPRNPAPWTEVYNADVTPPGCAQVCDLPEGTGTCPDEWSEDCLYLNVYAPATPAPQQGYDVLFWIHGGAFESGTGICALYNGTGLTQDNTVVVSINYRLGAMVTPPVYLPLQYLLIPINTGLHGLRVYARQLRLHGHDPGVTVDSAQHRTVRR